MVYFWCTAGKGAQIHRLFLKRLVTYTGARDTQGETQEVDWEQG